MSSPIKEELHRFNRLFFTYGKVILGGMILSAIFLLLYGGIRANYLTIEIFTVVIASIALSLTLLVGYFRIQMRKSKLLNEQSAHFIDSVFTDLESRSEAEQEKLRRDVIASVERLHREQLRSITRRRAHFEETLLLSTFRFALLLALTFYSGLELVKVQFGLTKDPKHI